MCKVNDKKARDALRAERCVDSFIGSVTDARKYQRLTAPLRPGGAFFKRCTRKEKRRMRCVLHAADRLVHRGELGAAIELVRG